MFVRALLLLLLIPAVSAAQERPDTVPRTEPGDPLQIEIPPEQLVPDTVPFDSLRTEDPDSLLPAPLIPAFIRAGEAGSSMGRFVFDRGALLHLNALSLHELIERVPGMTVVSAGGFGHAAGVTVAGQGGGRVRVWRDGFELDPLHAANHDLQQIPLIDLERVIVERSTAETRIHLESARLPDRRPFSEIEALTGNFDARTLRARISRPISERSVLSAAYDLASSGGYVHLEPFSFGSGRVRWDYVFSPTLGAQLEFSQSGTTRDAALHPTDFDRREFLLRTRARPRPNLTVEALVARTSHLPAFDRDALGRPIDVGSNADTLDARNAVTQGMLRARLSHSAGFLEGTAQLRAGSDSGFTGPARDLTARAGLSPGLPFSLEARARYAGGEAGDATEFEVDARTAPILGFSAFAGLSAGERFVRARSDTIVLVTDPGLEEEGEEVLEVPIREIRYADSAADIGGYRAGLEWTGWEARVGVSMVTSNASTIAPLGTAFDRGLPIYDGGEVRGVEAYASVPGPGGFRAEGWYMKWATEGSGRLYLPEEQARLALVFHDVLIGGQFEPFARLEAVHRGGMFVPDTQGAGSVLAEGNTMLNFHLQLRIIDVRAFFSYHNLLNVVDAYDLPGRTLPGPRTVYGVRWFFRN